MKNFNLRKKVTAAAAVLTAGLLLTTAVAGAIPYQGPDTDASPTPAFNVFTGVPNVGNEAEFLKAGVPENGNDNATNTEFVDPLNASCEKGQRIQMRVYVHNGADRDGNDNGAGPSVARGTKVTVTLPGNEASTFTPAATISADNAASVSDNMTINCNGKSVKLKYAAGSAQQYSKATGVVDVSDTIVTTGALIRSHDKPGDVYGCWDERVWVVLSVVVEEVVPPVVPQPPVTPVAAPPVAQPPVATPVTPAAASQPVLPATGPASLAGMFGASTLLSALAYRWRLSRQ